MVRASFTTRSITAPRKGHGSAARGLKHANQYGLKYVFVRDRYYEPLLAFAGWRRRKAETYDNGNVTLWTKEDVPPRQKAPSSSGFMPTEFQGLMWGILPVGVSLLALLLVLLLPERRRVGETGRVFRLLRSRPSPWSCGRQSK